MLPALVFQRLIQPALFGLTRRDPEVAHEWAMRALLFFERHPRLLHTLTKQTQVLDRSLETSVFGRTYQNPLGLAAGFSKTGQGLRALESCGFGFLEFGGITPRRQSGNPRPRIQRLPHQGSLINWMGFNNPGATEVATTLRKAPAVTVPLWGNIGKQRDTPLELAAADYEDVMIALHPYVDVFVINLSSPNTAGLRDLLKPTYLGPLLGRVRERATILARGGALKPIVLKVSPDIDHDTVKSVAETCLEEGVGGIIAANTTVSRTGVIGPCSEKGGLSGPLLYERMLLLISGFRECVPDHFVLVACGGITDGMHAKHALNAGAQLVQIFTGFVYGGPYLPRSILQDLINRSYQYSE